MKLESIYRTTKTGLTVEFRSAAADEALLEIDYLKLVCAESPFLLSESEEVRYTPEEERSYLLDMEASDHALMLNAYMNSTFIGNGSFNAVSGSSRMSHRASIGIALFKEYCNCGIGEQLISVLIEEARKCGYEIMELDVYARNERGIHLYEKIGFEKCGCLRRAVKYKDGTYDDLILMQMPLQ